MTDQPGRRHLTEGQRVLVEFLRAHPVADGAAFEALCAAHPDHADELRRLWHAWIALGGVVGALHAPRRVVDRLVEQLGTGVGSGVELPESGDGEAAAAAPRRGPPLDEQFIECHRHVRYEIEGVLGSGAMGTVLRVRDPDLRRSLALKRIGGHDRPTPVGEVQPTTLARFLEEAQVTGQLEHPGIVAVHEVGMDQHGGAFFTMQRVRGATFTEVIRKVHDGHQDWPQSRALDVLERVCEAIAYAHSRCVIHRDLKSGNVMVGQFGETYVMDWGLARVIDRDEVHDIEVVEPPAEPGSLVDSDRLLLRDDGDRALFTREGTAVGTPSFMSPEQALGRLDAVGKRSDVYSIGAMLYHLLLGRPPYTKPGERPDPQVLLDRVRAGPPRPLREFDLAASEELVAICEKAMQRDVARRYPDAMALALDLRAFRDRRPITPIELTTRYVVGLWFDRNRTLAATIAGAVLLIALLGVVYLVNVRQARDDAIAAELEAETLRDRDLVTLSVDRAATLYPALPAMAQDMQDWLDEVDSLIERVTARAAGEGSDASSGGIAELDRLRAESESVRERLRFARALEERMGGEDRVAWEAAGARIEAAAVYDTGTLAPQPGLVPLGENAQGQYEFWYPLSGERPDWRPDGRFDVAPADGIVFVLLPGGEFDMGSPLNEEKRMPNEQMRLVEVPWFFLAKHEVTQAQWIRVMGANPSLHVPPRTVYEEVSKGRQTCPIGADHPVETVSWNDCVAFGDRLGVRLPSEVEWEFACRAGKSSAWHWGPDSSSLERHENVFDVSYMTSAVTHGGAPWNDGFPLHAPVGSFTPNGFGVYDMHGNVGEWCSDVTTEVDGLPEMRVFRGGSWFHLLVESRCAARYSALPQVVNQTLGVRVARSVVP